MSDIIQLPNTAALDIRDGNVLFHGGDQDWFTDQWQQRAGCGPTNCANLLWFLAQTQPGCAPLCPYNAAEKPGFLRLMQDVWHYVTPGNMGVNSTDLFTAGATRYAREKGVPLLAHTLNIAPMQGGKRIYTEVADFIARALQRGLPVAFLNLSNGTLDNLDSWHWVTLVALRVDEALIYDQGDARWVNLRRWLATSIIGGGFATLEHSKQALPVL